MAGPWNGPGRRSIALRLWDSYPLSADLIGHRLPPIVPTDPLLARRFLHRVFQTIPRGRGRFGRLRVVGSTTWKSSTFQGHGWTALGVDSKLSFLEYLFRIWIWLDSMRGMIRKRLRIVFRYFVIFNLICDL